MSEKVKFVYVETARTIERCFSRSDLACEFGIELVGRESVYDALIKQGHARNFHEAVRLVAKRLTPSRAGLSASWSDLALWSWDYDHG